MNNLGGIVLEFFIKEKKQKENVLYGEKGLDKFIEISFKGKTDKEKELYKKQWDVSKVSNSVYFVYKKEDNKVIHRFISDSWIDGGFSYLGHVEHT